VSESFDLGVVEHLTAGAVGEPGERVFYVQARARGVQVSILVEKDQVRVLCEAMQQVLDQLPGDDGGLAPIQAELALRSPLDPVWRAGEMSIEHDALTDRIVITLTELVDEDETGEGGRARFEASRASPPAVHVVSCAAIRWGRAACICARR